MSFLISTGCTPDSVFGPEAGTAVQVTQATSSSGGTLTVSETTDMTITSSDEEGGEFLLPYLDACLAGDPYDSYVAGNQISVYVQSTPEVEGFDREYVITQENLPLKNEDDGQSLCVSIPLVTSTGDGVEAVAAIAGDKDSVYTSAVETLWDESAQVLTDCRVDVPAPDGFDPSTLFVTGKSFINNAEALTMMTFTHEGDCFAHYALITSFHEFANISNPLKPLFITGATGNEDNDATAIVKNDQAKEEAKYVLPGMHHTFSDPELTPAAADTISYLGYDSDASLVSTNGDYCLVTDGVYQGSTSGASSPILSLKDYIDYTKVLSQTEFSGTAEKLSGMYCGDDSLMMHSVTYGNYTSPQGDAYTLSSEQFQGAVLKSPVDGESYFFLNPDSAEFLNEAGKAKLVSYTSTEVPKPFNYPHSSELSDDNRLLVYNRNNRPGSTSGLEPATISEFAVDFAQNPPKVSYVRTYETDVDRTSEAQGNASFVMDNPDLLTAVFTDPLTAGFAVFDANNSGESLFEASFVDWRPFFYYGWQIAAPDKGSDLYTAATTPSAQK